MGAAALDHDADVSHGGDHTTACGGASQAARVAVAARAWTRRLAWTDSRACRATFPPCRAADPTNRPLFGEPVAESASGRRRAAGRAHASAQPGRVRRPGAPGRRGAPAARHDRGRASALADPVGAARQRQDLAGARHRRQRRRRTSSLFSAVLSGVKELRAGVEEARAAAAQRPQHDPLRRRDPPLQQGAAGRASCRTSRPERSTLIGATTENPSFEIIAPLLSRTSVLVLQPLAADDLRAFVERALADAERGLGGARPADRAAGAGVPRRAVARRRARGAQHPRDRRRSGAPTAGRACSVCRPLEEAAQQRALRYDKGGEEHYNVVSAFIKSMRGSDPDAALYWMMRMLEAGDDPLFVARRMVIFAAEDVGTGRPAALLRRAWRPRTRSTSSACPKGRIPLAEAAVYLATAPKSNASYAAMLAAAEDVARARPAARAPASAQCPDPADEAISATGAAISTRTSSRTRSSRTPICPRS